MLGPDGPRGHLPCASAGGTAHGVCKMGLPASEGCRAITCMGMARPCRLCLGQLPSQDRGRPVLPLSLSHTPTLPQATCFLYPCVSVGTPGLEKGGDRLQRQDERSVILFLWFSFQAVTVNLFYLSLCKSLCRIKAFTSSEGFCSLDNPPRPHPTFFFLPPALGASSCSGHIPTPGSSGMIELECKWEPGTECPVIEFSCPTLQMGKQGRRGRSTGPVPSMLYFFRYPE